MVPAAFAFASRKIRFHRLPTLVLRLLPVLTPPYGTRPRKLVEAEPLQTSYGADLYDAIFGEGDATAGIAADKGRASTRTFLCCDSSEANDPGWQHISGLMNVLFPRLTGRKLRVANVPASAGQPTRGDALAAATHGFEQSLGPTERRGKLF
jgi:hypothetical protein